VKNWVATGDLSPGAPLLKVPAAIQPRKKSKEQMEVCQGVLGSRPILPSLHGNEFRRPSFNGPV